MIVVTIFPHYRFWLRPIAFSFTFFFTLWVLLPFSSNWDVQEEQNLHCAQNKTNPKNKTQKFFNIVIICGLMVKGTALYLYHLLQVMAARSQCLWCLKIPHSISCFAWVCSKICLNSENSLLFKKKLFKAKCKCIINTIKFCLVLKLIEFKLSNWIFENLLLLETL